MTMHINGQPDDEMSIIHGKIFGLPMVPSDDLIPPISEWKQLKITGTFTMKPEHEKAILDAYEKSSAIADKMSNLLAMFTSRPEPTLRELLDLHFGNTEPRV